MKNNSGFLPLILPEKCKLIVYIGPLGDTKTKGGIIVSAKNVEDDAYAATSGILVEMVSLDKLDSPNPKHQVKLGDKITFRPYAGIHLVGHDGHAYRLLEGREIHSLELNKSDKHA